jgi:hypothetical protein
MALAALLEPAPDHALALATDVPRHPARIHVGGVDQVEAVADEGIEHCERRSLVGRPAEHVAAEGERRDHEATAAERALLHTDLPMVAKTSPPEAILAASARPTASAGN